MQINYFTVRYNVTGSERKRLADCIARFLGCEKKYLGAPSMAYQVGYMTVSRDGAVTFDDRADSEEIETLLEELEGEGFHAEPAAEEPAREQTNDAAPEEPTEAPESGRVGLTVEMPSDKVAIGNLTKLLEAKGALIKKALGVSDLRVEVREDRITFPWFGEIAPDEALAYTRFISKLCAMAKEAKRVNATEKEVGNEKYAFRCFLLRLGFIGAEYKADRKILLRNLTGSSAFKNGGADHEISE